MRKTFEVWFYIGALLGFYGVLLTAAGAYQWVHPPTTVLAAKHATLWAGIALLLVGGAYTILYWPKPGAPAEPSASHDGSRLE